MAIIFNFNLPVIVTKVTSIICLPDPGNGYNVGAFQTATTVASGTYIIPSAGLIRNNAELSYGFPFSVSGSTQYYLPENSYTVNLPSSAYGGTSGNNTFSVLQINAVVAKLEPGFSRLQVTYSYGATGIGTSYFDVPYHEGWNLAERELNNVVDYIEDGFNSGVSQLNNIQIKLNYFQFKTFWRGISVSGQLSFTPATSGLEQGKLK